MYKRQEEECADNDTAGADDKMNAICASRVDGGARVDSVAVMYGSAHGAKMNEVCDPKPGKVGAGNERASCDSNMTRLPNPHHLQEADSMSMHGREDASMASTGALCAEREACFVTKVTGVAHCLSAPLSTAPTAPPIASKLAPKRKTSSKRAVRQAPTSRRYSAAASEALVEDYKSLVSTMSEKQKRALGVDMSGFLSSSSSSCSCSDSDGSATEEECADNDKAGADDKMNAICESRVDGGARVDLVAVLYGRAYGAKMNDVCDPEPGKVRAGHEGASCDSNICLLYTSPSPRD